MTPEQGMKLLEALATDIDLDGRGQHFCIAAALLQQQVDFMNMGVWWRDGYEPGCEFATSKKLDKFSIFLASWSHALKLRAREVYHMGLDREEKEREKKK